jgi:hypothetical protein
VQADIKPVPGGWPTPLAEGRDGSTAMCARRSVPQMWGGDTTEGWRAARVPTRAASPRHGKSELNTEH